MNNWSAPLLVAVLSTVGAVIVQEPGVALLGYVVACLGYSINKKAN
jgi:ABC-type thiamin/hydroxymethylpyrimidine transport system permease subunit